MRVVKIKINSAKVLLTDYVSMDGELKCQKDTLGKDGTPTESLFDTENLIHQNHISNMLHVLLGVRPVSTKYPNGHERSKYIDNIVANGLIRIDNDYRTEDYIDKEGNVHKRFNVNFMQGKKPYRNSNRQRLTTVASNGECMNGYITWPYLRKKMVYSSGYKKVQNILMEFGEFLCYDDVRKDYSLVDLLIKMRDYPEWCSKMAAIQGITPITSFLLDKDYNSKSGKGFNQVGETGVNLAGLLNLTAIYFYTTLNATVILFMEDADAENLIKGKRMATFLEGGVAFIENCPNRIQDFERIDNDDELEEIKEDFIDNENFTEIKDLKFTESYEN